MTESQYPKGLRLDATETDFIEGCLHGVAKSAKENNESKIFNMAMGLAQRVRQAEMAGEGIPPDLQERLKDGLDRAFASNKPELAQRAIENFMATMLRLHPDPARSISAYLLSYTNQSILNAAEAAAGEAACEAAEQIIERYKIKLESLRQTYKEEGEWPEPDELLEYLMRWTLAGLKAIQTGGEPWKGDPDIMKAMDSEVEHDDE